MWIPSLVLCRSQTVHVSDQHSAEVAVTSGVSKDSVLDTTLFIIYVNDCANEMDCNVPMFADDIKIWSTMQNEIDEARLQTDLDHLDQWSNDWILLFNVDKLRQLRLPNTRPTNRYFEPTAEYASVRCCLISGQNSRHARIYSQRSLTLVCATLDVLGRYIGGSGGMERSTHLPPPLPRTNSSSTEDSAASQEEAM
nr:unnamed protein product [Spirometra erinaceieuropaei]